MGLRRFSAYFAASTLIASIAAMASPASANDTSQITPLAQHRFDKWADVPGKFNLAGRIVDDEDNPIRGARIFATDITGEIELAKSGRGGSFKIATLLSPSTRLIIRHKMFAPRYIQAGALYNGESEPVLIEIIPYTERFDISPAGGIYQSGELTLEVPEGAVAEPITVLAAQLPLDHAYNNDGNIEPLRLTSVDLKPYGLTFEKPVTLTMTIAREDLGEVTEPISFYYDETLARYVRDPDSTVEVVEHRVAITLKHFSPHATADGKRAQSTLQLGRGTDLDGDGTVTPSDALFILLASGGQQEANASYSQSVAGSVRSLAGNAANVAANSGKSGFAFQGRSFAVSPAKPRANASLIADRFSLGRRWERVIDAALSVEADLYEFDCKLLVGQYDFHNTADWEKITPGSDEMVTIRQAWDAAMSDAGLDMIDGQFEYFTWQGGQRHIIAQALPGSQTIAVTLGEKGLEVYAQRDSFLIAKFRHAVTEACPSDIESALWASTDAAVKGVRGHKARHTAMKDSFHFGSQTSGSSAELPWGTFNRADLNVYSDMNCKSEESQAWNYAVNWNIADATSHHLSPAQAETRIWTTTSLPDSAAGAPSADLQAASAVQWSISNPGSRYFSQYLTAGLFKVTPEGPIPFGFMLHRTGERPCHNQPGIPRVADGPDSTSPTRGGPFGLASRDE